jgi:hypothetical protein
VVKADDDGRSTRVEIDDALVHVLDARPDGFQQRLLAGPAAEETGELEFVRQRPVLVALFGAEKAFDQPVGVRDLPQVFEIDANAPAGDDDQSALAGVRNVEVQPSTGEDRLAIGFDGEIDGSWIDAEIPGQNDAERGPGGLELDARPFVGVVRRPGLLRVVQHRDRGRIEREPPDVQFRGLRPPDGRRIDERSFNDDHVLYCAFSRSNWPDLCRRLVREVALANPPGRRYDRGMTILLLSCLLAAPPGLVADATRIDRGDVRAGPMLRQTFTITNRLAESVAIAGLDSGCGCLKRSVSKTELKPGETATVSMDLNTLTQPDGPQTWTLKLRYRPASLAKTAPDESLDFQVSAKLAREVSAAPPMLALSTEAGAKASIALVDSRKVPFAIKKLVSSSPFVTAKHTGTGGKFTIDVTVDEKLAVGTHDETVMVFTDDALYGELRIPVRIVKRAKNAVSAYPESLELEDGRGIVQFRRADGQPVKIESATCAMAGVTVTASSGRGPVATVKVIAAGSGGKADVTVTFAEPAGATRTIVVRWGD